MVNPNEYSNYIKVVAKESGLVFGSRFFGYILGFLIQLLFARLLGVENYGLYSLGLTMVNIGVLFATFGMSSGQIRFLGEYIGKGTLNNAKGVILSAFQIAGIISIILSIGLIIFRKFIAINIFHDKRLIGFLPWFSVILLFYTFLNLFGGTFQGLKKPSIFFFYKEIVERVIRISLFFGIYFIGYKLIGAIFSTIISGAMICFLLFLNLKKVAPFLFESKVKPTFEKEKFLRYSSNMLFVSFSYFLMGQVNRLILGIYSNARTVGLYTIADTIAQLSIFFLIAFNSIFSSYISELYHTYNKITLSKLYSDITRWIISLTLPLTIWMVIYSDSILKIFGKEYIEAKIALIFLAVGQFINAAVGSNGLILSMTNYQKYEMLNGFFIASLNLGLNIWLVPKYGITGSAIAGMLAISLVNIIKLIEVYIALKMVPYNWKYLKPALSGAFTILIMFFLQIHITTLIGLFFALILSFVIMLLCLILFGVFPEDKEIFKMFMSKFTRKHV